MSNYPAIPDGCRPAYTIAGFGGFSASSEDNDLKIGICGFNFGNGTTDQNKSEQSFVVKYALQAIINRLQEHCDGLNDEPLEVIMSFGGEPSPGKDGE